MQGYLKSTARKTVQAAAEEARAQAAEIKADLDQELNIYRAKVQEMLDKLEEKKKEVQEMTRQSVQKNLQIPELVREVAAIKASKKETHAQLDELKSQLQTLQDTAGQGVTQEQLASVNNKYAGVLAAIEKHTKNIASINEKVTSMEQFETTLSQKQIRETHNLHDANTKIDKLEEKSTAQEKKIKSLINLADYSKAITDEFAKDKKDLWEKANEASSSVSKQIKRTDDLERRAKDLETSAKDLETRADKARADLKVLYAQSRFSGIKQAKFRKIFFEEKKKRHEETEENLRRTETEEARASMGLPPPDPPAETRTALKL